MHTGLLAQSVDLTTRNLLFDLLTAPLNSVPFHQDSPAVTRYISDKFPVHLAVHEISPLIHPPAIYTQSHVHDDEDEINIIISSGTLQYLIVLADEEHIISSNSTSLFQEVCRILQTLFAERVSSSR